MTLTHQIAVLLVEVEPFHFEVHNGGKQIGVVVCDGRMYLAHLGAEGDTKPIGWASSLKAAAEEVARLYVAGRELRSALRRGVEGSQIPTGDRI